jgi:hypothetical protein
MAAFSEVLLGPTAMAIYFGPVHDKSEWQCSTAARDWLIFSAREWLKIDHRIAVRLRLAALFRALRRPNRIKPASHFSTAYSENQIRNPALHHAPFSPPLELHDYGRCHQRDQD